MLDDLHLNTGTYVVSAKLFIDFTPVELDPQSLRVSCSLVNANGEIDRSEVTVSQGDASSMALSARVEVNAASEAFNLRCSSSAAASALNAREVALIAILIGNP